MKQIRYVKLENPDGTYSDAIPFSTDSDHIDDTSSAHKFTTAAEKIAWNNKYMKPVTGIPSTDLAQSVLASLTKADNAVPTSSLVGFSSIQVVSKLPTIEQNNVLYLVIDGGSAQNLIDLNSNCTLVDENATHLVNTATKLTLSVYEAWARTNCVITGLDPNMVYTLSASITNSSQLYCGLFENNNNHAIGTDALMSKSLTLTSNSSGEISFDFYGNLTNVTESGTVIFDNLELYSSGAPVQNLYPGIEEGHTESDGFTVTFSGQTVSIDGRNDTSSVYGWTPHFSGMNLDLNKQYYIQFVRTSGSIDNSARVAQDDGMVTSVNFMTYDMEGNELERPIQADERPLEEIYDKYYFTLTTAYDTCAISMQAKKLNVFDNWTCDIIIAEADEN